MNLVTQRERHQALYDAHSSNRAIHSTPALRAFVRRSDVNVLRFPSGSHYVFIGDRPFYGATELEAVEAAMLAELRGAA
jgi:hypothetical protein